MKLLGFLLFLPKSSVFDKVLDLCLPEAKAQKLKDAYRIRWIQRIDSYIVFLELLPALHITLQAMAFPRQYQDLGNNWSWDGDSVTKANSQQHFSARISFIFFKILLRYWKT